MVLLAVPSHVLRTVLEQIPFEALGQAVVISVVKGIEAGTLMRMSEMALEVWKIFPPENIAALSGPSLSREVVQGVPTTVVIASTSLHTAQWAQRIFFAPRFRVYASQDVIGVELGGALKNVIAIAAGISDGLGFGDNAKGALLTRGLSEIARLGILMGGKEKTFAGLSGMGDLITTCVSSLSRNHYVGYHLGKGRKLPEILSEMKMVAEGINTTKAALGLAQKYDLEMPIVKAVHAILFEDKDPRQSVGELMTRMLKVED
jgi:glycerol-3-phosphate dehydrogenase (NAD(P)+)